MVSKLVHVVRQCCGARRNVNVPASGGSLPLMSILVAAESLRCIKLPGTVETLKEPVMSRRRRRRRRTHLGLSFSCCGVGRGGGFGTGVVMCEKVVHGRIRHWRRKLKLFLLFGVVCNGMGEEKEEAEEVEQSSEGLYEGLRLFCLYVESRVAGIWLVECEKTKIPSSFPLS